MNYINILPNELKQELEKYSAHFSYFLYVLNDNVLHRHFLVLKSTLLCIINNFVCKFVYTSKNNSIKRI